MRVELDGGRDGVWLERTARRHDPWLRTETRLLPWLDLPLPLPVPRRDWLRIGPFYAVAHGPDTDGDALVTASPCDLNTSLVDSTDL